MSRSTLKPLSDNVHLLGEILGETIRQFEGAHVFNKVETLRRLAQKTRMGHMGAQREFEKELHGLSQTEKYKVVKAFTEFLQLANLCEQVHRIRRRNDYLREGKAPQRGAPLDTFGRLLKAGIPAKTIRAALLDIRIELVLTAHPTEAELPRAIRTYRDLSVCLLKLDAPEMGAVERALVLHDIRSLVIRLWLGSGLRDAKPTPVEEARYGLELAESILWHTVPRFHYLMSLAYKDVVGDMSDLFPHPIHFASWMGGDRDGHPGVTARVTREVLHESSQAATERYLLSIAKLRDILVFDRDGRGLKLHNACQRRLDKMEKALQDFRRDLPRGKTKLTRTGFLGMLYELQDFLKDNGLDLLAQDPLQQFIWRVRVFGLCFLKLDIRQSADVHETAIAELLGKGKGKSYAALPEEKKIAVLTAALKGKAEKPRRISAQTAEVLETLRLYREMPPEFLGPYIISMAAHVSDVLGVMFLMKTAGVKDKVPVCPLFETPDSLKNACGVMQELYRMPLYKRHAGGAQQIMIGYSDSAKRGGYLNAAWEIYRLQSDLLKLGKRLGIKTTFFHGRGGSIARGGGPIETALMALPRPHVSHSIRITEQGETINSKFGLPDVAERTMELYLSGFLEAVLSKPEKTPPQWAATMDRVAARSCKAFRDVIYETPEFMGHYRQITPTAELGLLNIGSRPGRRKKDGGLESLRAIPWVFGWTQSRTLLPAWLGVAEALEAEIAEGNLKTLQEMYRDWPFFEAVVNLVEMVAAKADERITEYYSELLVDPALQHLTRDYLARLARTKKALLKVMRHRKILETVPVLARSIRLRAPYVDVLNILQAHLLKEYRAHKNPPATLRRTLALTIS
ncbi:MAG: phosphoenolpyruvate carboxylase, partial [Alphaproteobacteria bacterium]|nr:phosphoenolpyruvate carboxylase [Alphaproteobacteria bacterium]